MKRIMSVAGSFYPDNAQEIIEFFNYFNKQIQDQYKHESFKKEVKALIVPHAGYIYSGLTANLAYINVKRIPKRIIVLGPSHKVLTSGLSMNAYSRYDTPLGEIESDIEYMTFLKTKFNFKMLEHKEHSTEVQFPFIKYYFPQSKLVEIIYYDNQNLKELIETILSDADNLLVVSTDLSHFYNQNIAKDLDNNFIFGTENLDISLIKKSEACGIFGIIALIEIAKKMSLHVKSLDYRTSGDISGDSSSVVGYYSALFF